MTINKENEKWESTNRQILKSNITKEQELPGIGKFQSKYMSNANLTIRRLDNKISHIERKGY